MKNKKFLLTLPILGMLGVATLLGCNNQKSEFDVRTHEIYQEYKNAGGTQTYEEWLNSIKGAKDDKGDKGDKGDTGAKGADGVTPHIGENGNWWIDTTDTGIKAQGKDGVDGKDGINGKNGTNGRDGQTAWSCSFVSFNEGYVTMTTSNNNQLIGSATVNTMVRFVIHYDQTITKTPTLYLMVI